MKVIVVSKIKQLRIEDVVKFATGKWDILDFLPEINESKGRLEYGY